MNATVSILIIRDNQYVLQHRDNIEWIAYPNTYGVWGGAVESTDATYEAAAIRELEEETGLIILESQLIALGNEVWEGSSLQEKGKQVRFYYFALHLEPDTVFEVHEGQGVKELPIPYTQNEIVNIVTASVIARYEKSVELV